MLQNEHRFYEFGDFKLDTEERVLFKRGEPVPITFRAYEVLRVLILNSGRIMEKDDLMRTVWGDTIVEEGNLKNLVYSLRKALGDETGNSQFIQTLPRRGYRFVAEVQVEPAQELIIERHTETDITIEEEIEVVPDVETQPAGVLPITTMLRTKNWWARPWMIAPAAVLIALGVAAYFFNFTPGARRVFALENAKVTPLTFGTNALFPVISPDGKFVAYVYSDEKGKSIFVRQLASNSTLKLMDFSGSLWDIKFSADSNFVYFVNGNDEYPDGVLYQIPALGGQSKKLIEDISGLSVSQIDGRIVFVRQNKFFIATGNGQDQRELFDFNETLKGKFQSYSWSPDGNSLLASIVRMENNVPYWQIAELSLNGTGERPIGERFARPVTVTATPDGTGVIVLDTDSSAFTSRILYLPRYGGDAPKILNRDTNFYNGLSITADGKTLLASRQTRPTKLTIAPAKDLSKTTQAASGYMTKVAWTNDGKLIFDAIENGQTDIWSFDPDNASRRQLTSNAKRNATPSLSPDNSYIYYSSNLTGRSQLWRMKRDGSDPKQLTDLPYSVTDPATSPDGKYVYFTGYVDTSSKLFRVSAEGGEPQKIIDQAIGLFAVSNDGNKVAYTTFNRDKKKEEIVVHDLAQPTADKVYDLPNDIYWTLKWSLDGRTLNYIGNENAATSCIYSQPLTGGAASPITCAKNDNFVNFAWSPDGERLAATTCHYVLDAVTFLVQ